MKKVQNRTTSAKGATHDTVMPLLVAMFEEFKDLAKKKPDASVSKSKLALANRLLKKTREVLADEDSIFFLDLLEEDDVPQVSDVTLVFSQYVAAMKAFHDKYYGYNGLEHAWLI